MLGFIEGACLPIVRVDHGEREVVLKHILVPEPVNQPGSGVALSLVRTECPLGVTIKSMDGNDPGPLSSAAYGPTHR